MGYADLSQSQKKEVALMAELFEPRLVISVIDWAHYKVGRQYGLFTDPEVQAVESFFFSWPKAWALIRPHFDNPDTMHIRKPADRFADELETYFGIGGQDSFRYLITLEPAEDQNIGGLGIAPLIIIAGIALLAVLGVSGALWAIGYWKEQDNVTMIITGVTSGRIDESILSDAVNTQHQSIFGEVSEGFTSLAVLLVVGGGLWVFSNILSSAGVFRKAHA